MKDVESITKSFAMQNTSELEKYFFIVTFFIQAVPDIFPLAQMTFYNSIMCEEPFWVCLQRK